MSLRWWQARHKAAGAPRVSGDEPYVHVNAAQAQQCSPRERG